MILKLSEASVWGGGGGGGSTKFMYIINLG